MSQAKREVRQLVEPLDLVFDEHAAWEVLRALPVKAVQHALQSVFCADRALARHWATALLGLPVAELAESDLEVAVISCVACSGDSTRSSGPWPGAHPRP